jgi:hypothetical protein
MSRQKSACQNNGGEDRAIPECHVSVQLNHFIPGFRSYSVAVFLKWRSDLTPGEDVELGQAFKVFNRSMTARLGAEPLSSPYNHHTTTIQSTLY